MEKKRSRIPVLPFSGPGVADSSGWHENPTCLRESLLGFKKKMVVSFGSQAHGEEALFHL